MKKCLKSDVQLEAMEGKESEANECEERMKRSVRF